MSDPNDSTAVTSPDTSTSPTVDRGVVVRQKGDYRQRKRVPAAVKADIITRAETLGYRRGYQVTIAKDLGISQATVSKTIKASRNKE